MKLKIIEVLLESIVVLVLILIQLGLDSLIKALLKSVFTLSFRYLKILFACLGCPMFDIFFELIEDFMIFA